ncbi:twin-arginine translocation signal domain-containing protein, partial [Vibrio cholerae]
MTKITRRGFLKGTG